MYFNGDKAEPTGKTKRMYGGLFYEYKMTEGHKIGQSAWTQRKPNEGMAEFNARLNPLTEGQKQSIKEQKEFWAERSSGRYKHLGGDTY